MMDEQQSRGREPLLSRRVLLWAVLGVALASLASGAWFYWTGKTGSGTGGGNEEDDPPPARSGPPWFRDMTAGSGVQFTYRNGEEANEFTILESLGGGAGLIDYDGDGLLDIFLTGGGCFGGPDGKTIEGHPCKLYRNLGGWKFQDVTAAAGLDLPWWYTHGAAVADYDRDGWPDLVVTGYGKLALFHNEPDGKGGRRFADVTEKAGLKDDSWSTSAGWADLDGDGFPDLYVCHYVDWSFANHPVCPGERPNIKREICGPQWFGPLVHALFHNEKGKRFENVSAAQGFRKEGSGLGVVLADFNGDRQPDIYVANDRTNKFLFFNREGKLEEKGVPAGAALDEAGKATGSMGADAADCMGNGLPSLWVTNYEREMHGLYRNLGKEFFQYDSWAGGMGAIGQSYVGWGTKFADFDNDGWEDLVIVNGHLFRHPAGSPVKQPPLLLHNVEQRQRRTFKDVSPQGGGFFETPAVSRGLAAGDLDNDGWLDLVVSRTNSPAVLVRNEAVSKAHWLGVQLVGRGNRDAVGSTAILEAGARKLTRFTKGGGSYLSASDPRLLFGLGDAERVGRLTVKWSWGKEETFGGLEPDAYWEIREGEPRPRKVSGLRP